MDTKWLQPGISIKPKVSESSIVDIIYNCYGLKAKTINQLNGYDDLNFHIIVEEKGENENIDKVSKNGYVLKIINQLDSMEPELYQAQNQLLLHLGAQGICCPKSVPSKMKTLFCFTKLSSGDHIVRLLEFIPGKTLKQVFPTPELFIDCGRFVATLDCALKNFLYPVYNTHRTDVHKKELIKDVINEFRETVLPFDNQLEKGMIHGDFNEENILVEKENSGWKVKGVLDFGDTHKSCYVYELAIAMAYMIILGKSLDAGKFVIEGYNLVRKIPNLEYSLLKVCIAARLCQSLILGAYSIQMDPKNKYILVSSEQGWIMLVENTQRETFFKMEYFQ